jgi:hypothetical protein
MRDKSLDDKLPALASIDLLRGWSRADLRRLCRDTDVVDVPAGELIDRSGTRARQFVGIVDGLVRATSDDGAVTHLGTGDGFGAAEIAARVPHARTYTTEAATRLVVVFGPTFHAVAARLIRARRDDVGLDHHRLIAPGRLTLAA